MDSLILVPARGGSKGIPRKNIKELGGRPLIHYTLDVARQIGDEGAICVSTDSEEIRSVVEGYGIEVPFIRPRHLATDNATTYEVILHALDYYEERGRRFNKVILLQPTSPFREEKHVRDALGHYDDNLDMVVSVTKTRSNPYYVLYEENDEGYLEPSKEGEFTRRQDCPAVYEINGAVYVMNVQSLRESSPKQFTRVKKSLMDQRSSVDIDTPFDWKIAECLINKESK